jgi:beta-glucosidase
MDCKLTNKASIPALINEMTLEEKADLITGASPFHTRALEEYGVPPALLLDGGTGVNTMQLMIDLMYKACIDVFHLDDDAAQSPSGMESFGVVMPILPKMAEHGSLTPEEQRVVALATAEVDKLKPEGASIGCFPPGMLLGATWDPQTVYACAQALGREVSAHQIDVLLGTPNVNVHRDPLNGRLFEGYSEDPCLVSKLAPEFVKGIQDQGIIANAKHFAANNQETERMGVNEHIPLRALHEIYFPGFKACVQQGGVRTIMSAYNQINGRPCAMNRWLLTDVLRDKWGFDGFVMSDWGAAYDQVEAAAAGNDLVMPGPRNTQCLVDAVNSGALSESDVDRCVANYLAVLLEMPVIKGRRYATVDAEFSRQAAYRAAAEGIVLLKNKGNLLPLSKNDKVCFYGPGSKQLIESGGGSAQVWTDLSSNPYDCAIAKIGSERVSFEAVAQDTRTVIITVGAKGQEGADRPSMDVEAADKAMLEKAIAEAKAVQARIVVILNVAGPVSMMDWIDDVDAVLCVFFPGMEGGRAAADILFGDLNPSGKLPLTFPKYYRDSPAYGNFPGEFGEVWYGEGIYVGYRYYDLKGIEPLYPFGHGLSFTTFELAGLRVPPVVRLDEGEKVTAWVKVKNRGQVAGKEVVQLYLSDEVSTLHKPPKELKAFKKVLLEPGEEKDIVFELSKDDLASFDVAMDRWVTEPGYYQLLVGTSSRNIVLSGRFEAVCENPYGYGPDTAIGKLMSDPRAVDVIRKHTGLEPSAVLGASLIFASRMRFSQAWDTYLSPALADRGVKEGSAIQEAIESDLKQIDTTELGSLTENPLQSFTEATLPD